MASVFRVNSHNYASDSQSSHVLYVTALWVNPDQSHMEEENLRTRKSSKLTNLY